MRSVGIWLAAVVAVAGCAEGDSTPAPLPTVASPAEPNSSLALNEKEPSPEKAAEKKPETKKDDSTLTEPKELKLRGGMTFTAPAGWRVVPVSGNIPDAELAVPHVEGDEFDARLTLMSALAGLDTNIDRWKGEFLKPGEVKTEKIKIDGVEATLVDIRGEWKGTSFRPIDPPRPDHRLIAVYIPFDGPNAYYVKLTGPKATLAKRDEEFRKFLKSGKIDK